MIFREACICLGRMTVSVFEELARALRAPGYSLDHPESHTVQIVRTEADVTSDDELIGEQLPLSRAELLKRIDQRRPTMVVFWGSDWYTLDCTIYFGTTADLLSCELGRWLANRWKHQRRRRWRGSSGTKLRRAMAWG